MGYFLAQNETNVSCDLPILLQKDKCTRTGQYISTYLFSFLSFINKIKRYIILDPGSLYHNLA